MNQIYNLYCADLLPQSHKNYLKSIQGINPPVIYDIGSCVLHWTKVARNVWPGANIICFDAIEEVRHLYNQNKLQYFSHVLSDNDGDEKFFYKSLVHLGGQSLYRENPELNRAAAKYFNDSSRVRVVTSKLDTIVEKYNLPLPSLIKIDVQGSELDILRGATKTIENCNDIILELQEVNWNIGAPKKDEAIEFMKSIGYTCIAEKFSKNYADADYHFRKIL